MTSQRYRSSPGPRRRLAGAALVEMALALPLLLLVVVGGIDLSWIVRGRVLAQSALVQTGRYAAMLDQDCADRANAYFLDKLGSAGLSSDLLSFSGAYSAKMLAGETVQVLELSTKLRLHCMSCTMIGFDQRRLTYTATISLPVEFADTCSKDWSLG